ncbi:MAG TPA: phosphotransferase [Polyangiaceae bacterium]
MMVREEQRELVRRAFPGCTVLGASPLQGGISSQATRFDVLLPDGQEKRVVVRTPRGTGEGAIASAAAEYEVLCLVRRFGIAAPVPRLVNELGDMLVLDYVDGAPELSTPADSASLQRMAEELARIHAISAEDGKLPFLANRWRSVEAMLASTPAELDRSLDEEGVRRALASAWPWPRKNRSVLLHGDYWPANVLWKEGRLTAVIDWEEAETGDPLADVSVSRLDILWAFGFAAMEEFTRAYARVTNIDWSTLPVWDLVAAMRPMGNLARWASSYALPPVSRPDIDEAAMRRGHRDFVARALSVR